MVRIADNGVDGQLISLAGLKGRRGLGAVLDHRAATCPAGVKTQILQSNPGRVYALITNGDTARLYLSFTEDTSYNIHPLDPGGSFQIDRDFPWTGGVWGYNATVQVIVGLTDAGVQL